MREQGLLLREGAEVECGIALRPDRRRQLPATAEGRLLQWVERAKARIRAKVEHPFRVIKEQFGFCRTRLRGMAKNYCKVTVLAALANLCWRRRGCYDSVQRRSGVSGCGSAAPMEHKAGPYKGLNPPFCPGKPLSATDFSIFSPVPPFNPVLQRFHRSGCSAEKHTNVWKYSKFPDMAGKIVAQRVAGMDRKNAEIDIFVLSCGLASPFVLQERLNAFPFSMARVYGPRQPFRLLRLSQESIVVPFLVFCSSADRRRQWIATIPWASGRSRAVTTKSVMLLWRHFDDPHSEVGA